ncbi:hypothetical protein EUTSA_v10002306mg, partial [Eutrema salsugineum]
MGDNAAQLPDAMQQLLDDMRSLSDHLNLMEQRLPPQAPPNNNGNQPREQPRQQHDYGEEESDEDLPGLDEDQPPDPNQQQRRKNNHGLDQPQRPFAGKGNHEAYLDWKRRMDHIFDYYQYSEAKKVSLAVAQLTKNALTWWDREVSERRRLR